MPLEMLNSAGGAKLQTLTNESTNINLYQQERSPRTSEVLNLKPLTIEELCNVQLATVRESTNHRRWPPNVIQHFLTVKL